MLHNRPKGFRKEDHEVIIFEDVNIQRMFTSFLRKELGVADPFAWKERFGAGSYERLRKKFLRTVVYPTTFKIVKKPRGKKR